MLLLIRFRRREAREPPAFLPLADSASWETEMVVSRLVLEPLKGMPEWNWPDAGRGLLDTDFLLPNGRQKSPRDSDGVGDAGVLLKEETEDERG
jgi:hypothetical protein